MRKEQIISKGIYTGAQYPELVSVKQYIIFRKNGEKCLLLRLSNDRGEAVSAVKFRLKQMDVKGNVLRNDTYLFDDINAEAGKTFALDKEIVIDEGCVDFAVEMESAQYGEYEYTLKNGELIAAYNEKSNDPSFDKEGVRKKFGGRNQNIIGKTLHAPKMILFSMLAALLIIAAFSYAQLRYFMSTEETFTLENVEYAFTTDDRESGPISIISYKGKAGNVTVPVDIEGHKVVSIAEGAFDGKRLVTVTVEGDIVIGDYAFKDCKQLESVDMPYVTSIGNGIFEGCSSLTSVNVERITYIGQSAFSDCKALEEIKLPLTLTKIESYAFSGCESLKALVIPDSVESIGEGILSGCADIGALKLPFVGSDLSHPDKIKYLYGSNNYDKAVSNLVSITVTKMTEVVDEAFLGCSSVQSVSLPDNVTRIGVSAFKGCKALADFKIPSGVKSIGASAFSGCASIKDVNIPFDVVELPAEVFSGCSSLVSVSLPSSLLHIRANAFADCCSIASIIIPVNLQTLEKGAFANCTGVKDLTLSFIGKTVNEPYTLEELFGTTEVQLENIRVRGAKSLAEYTFKGFAELVSVNIGGMIEKIEKYCFADATSLKTVVLPDSVIGIEEGAFANCTSLEGIDMPKEITAIKDMTFMNCESLKELNIPENVTSVGESAFAGCKSLTDTEWIERIKKIGNNAFEGCEGMESVTVNSAITKLPEAIFKDCINLTEIVLPTALTDIGNDAFNGCKALESVEIPEQVTRIGNGAFSSCEALTEIEFPASVVEIGDSAFKKCIGLTVFSVPASVETIGNTVISGCTSLKELTLPFMGETSEQNATIKYTLGEEIPKSLERVVLLCENYISNGAFYGCKNIKEIILNEGIKEISSDAFYGCESLEEITFNSDLESVGENAFYGCVALKSVSFNDSLTSIGEYAFFNCGFEEIELPSSLERVGQYAFAKTAITKIDIPKSVWDIGVGILNECPIEEISVPFIGNSSDAVESPRYLFDNRTVPSSLKKMKITGSSITGHFSIRPNAFANCRQLEEVEITGNITEIGDYAFENCVSLKSIALPDTLLSVGEYCFRNNEKLTSIVFPQSVKVMGRYSLEGCNSLTEISIPFVGIERNDTNDFSSIFGSGNWGLPQSLKKITVTNETAIKSNAFYGCQYIEEIVYDMGITEIGAYAFASCHRLDDVKLSDTLESIGEWAFSWCYDLSSIVIPEGVKTIGYQAFNYCCNLLEVYNYSSLQQYELWNVSLTSHSVVYRTDDTPVVRAEANGLEFILGDNGNWYFNKSERNATRIVFPESITTENGEITQFIVPNQSFYENKKITSVTVTNAVKEINYDAFYGCENLKEIYNLSDMNIEKGSYDYGQIGYYAYIIHTSLDDEPLTEVKIDGLIFMKSDDNWFLTGYEGTERKLVLDEFEYEGKTVSAYEVSPYAFRYNVTVEELVIGNAVKQIGRQAFYNMDSLKKVSFEENTSITKIPENCFTSCYNLEQVVLPSSLTEIGSDAFYDCTILIELYNLSELELTKGSYDYGNVARYAVIIHGSMDEEPLKEVKIGNFTYLKSDDIWILKEYRGSDTKLELKDFEYEGKKITSYTISSRAFSYSPSLKEIIIGNEVKAIGERAFEDCHSLEKVSFENNTSIEVIPEYTFAWCYALQTVTLPSSLKDIKYYAFGSCNNLVEVYNPSELELSLGSDSYGSVALNAVVIHTSLDEEPLKTVKVDGYEFITNEDDIWVLIKYTGTKEVIDFKDIKYNDKAVTNIIIKRNAFSYLNNVKKVIFGDEVARVEAFAFEYCYGLEYVSFKDCPNITFIYEYSFRGCDSLNTVIISEYITYINYDAFYDCRNMYNVCNLSSMNITKGSTDFGCIGQFAKNICYSVNDIVEIQRVKNNNITYIFRKIDGNWEIYGADFNVNYTDTLILPELIINDEAQKYDISIKLPSCRYLIIPKTVNSISNVQGMSIAKILCYDYDNVLKIFGESYNADVYCYAECVHKDGEWTYGSSGEIITYRDRSVSYVDATCVKEGIKKFTCNRCDKTWQEEIPLVPHLVNLNEKMCEICLTKFDTAALSDYWDIENNAAYPFSIDIKGTIKSTNTTGISVLTLTAKSDFCIALEASVSESVGTGYGNIQHNGTSYWIFTSSNNRQLDLRIKEGDKLIITFVNGTSQATDCLTISNMVYSDK